VLADSLLQKYSFGSASDTALIDLRCNLPRKFRHRDIRLHLVWMRNEFTYLGVKVLVSPRIFHS